MILPLVVPPAVTGMMFLLMYDGSFGVISHMLYGLGWLSPTQPILANASTALWGVIIADVWQWTPFMVLIMLAGLRALPKDPFEAAAIDGATDFQAFFRLTLPMMSKIIAMIMKMIITNVKLVIWLEVVTVFAHCAFLLAMLIMM